MDTNEGRSPEDKAATALGKHRSAMMRFLGGTISAFKGARVQLDPFTKFGLHLIVAGAADFLGERNDLEPEQRLRLIRDTLEVLEAKSNLAQSFCDRLEEYPQTPCYLDMI